MPKLKELDELFLEEGIDPSGADYKRPDQTSWLWKKNGEPIGMFSLRIENGLPFLSHLLVRKKYRNIDSARFLIKKFVSVSHSMGYKHAIVHAPKNDHTSQKLLCHFFRKPFYGSSPENRFMLVEV